MVEARKAVLETYDTFLNSPDTTLLSDFATGLAERTRERQVFVSSSATMIRELMLDGRDPRDYLTLAGSFETINAEQLKERLTTAFPAAESLAVFAAGPDPSGFLDACVITDPRDAQDCW